MKSHRLVYILMVASPAAWCINIDPPIKRGESAHYWPLQARLTDNGTTAVNTLTVDNLNDPGFIISYSPGWNGTEYTRGYHTYKPGATEMTRCPASGEEYVCAGVRFQKHAALDAHQALALLSAYINTGGIVYAGQLYFAGATGCSSFVSIYNGSRLYRFTYSCTPSVPTPASCTVTGPSSLVHADATIGESVSVKQGEWRVECDTRTSITFNVSGDVRLTSDGHDLPSKLSVGKFGQTEQPVVVDRAAMVTIISTINTRMNNPGRYAGSSVISITWD